jgi:hypothetical protein
MITENLTKYELLRLSETIQIEKEKLSGFDKTVGLLDAINELLAYCLQNIVVDGKLKISLFDIPSLYQAAKKFVQVIIDLFGTNYASLVQGLAPINGFSIIAEYFAWCIGSIVSDRKVSVSIWKIIPFVIRTIKLIRQLVDRYKK